MFKKIIDFYKVSEPIPAKASTPEENERKLKRLQWATFLSATIGYGTYYVCRLSLNVIKKPIVDNGVFSETELGIIGSVLFFTYAIGKFTNGFLADRSNIKRLMSTGLLVTALVNLALGFTNSFILFAVLWGLSGWFQSMGAASCVVGLSRWFNDKNRGTFYGFWSASHNIGEAMTFIFVAPIDWNQPLNPHKTAKRMKELVKPKARFTKAVTSRPVDINRLMLLRSARKPLVNLPIA
jgi:OPA family sugar phosphate sensor protein UhpC-like MFS transporter